MKERVIRHTMEGIDLGAGIQNHLQDESKDQFTIYNE